MDSPSLPEGPKRCSPGVFFLWLLPWLVIMAWGGLAAGLCLVKGLNQTNMSNVFAFALWIIFDLGVIALGAGAFFTGFLTYVIGKKELKNIINAAVIIGFICYSGATAMLGIDIGQPIRGWFIFWHANIHSMLVEVSFCITCYLGVLIVEFVPIILENRRLDKIKELHIFGHNLHHVMGVIAATGTFLSFFHQGSLGGMFGVLYGRPFAARGGFYIWPWTFFLFILSAIAAGPCFTILCTKLTELLSRKKLVPDNAVQLLAKISGWLLSLYMVLKIADTLGWIYDVAPRAGLNFMEVLGSATAPFLAGVIAVQSSLHNAILIISTSAWILCAIFFVGVAYLVPRDISTLRALMQGRAEAERRRAAEAPTS